ncbi:MAG: hypothetical protein H6601_09945 [Flavobacteriales bacterium]|nr:hypothetical protein [Flavobacteriales bacterium]
MLVAIDGFSQGKLVDKFHIDSLFPSNVSDTLNVEEFSFSDWVYGGEGRYLLNEVHNTHNYHPLYKNSQVRNDLGNIGSAEHLVLFEMDRTFGFHFRNSRRTFWKSIDRRQLLISERMFSNVQYSNGQNRENYLVANFTRSFGKLLDLGFTFNRINSLGFYSRQKNTVTDMSVFSTFHSNDDRYRAALIFDYSNLKVEENGGIANDSVFENNITSGRDFITVNLPQSSNHWKGFDIGLEQRFILTKPDSISKVKSLRPAISHSFSVERHSMVYRNVPDTSSSFYEMIYSDTSTTYDSTNLLGVTNTLRFELLKPDSVKYRIINRLAVGATHSYYRVSYDSVFVENIHNVSVLGNVNGNLFGEVDWKANGSFMVYGYNIWDLKIDGQFDYRVGGSHFSAFVDYNLFRPDYISDRYVSNHFVWDNDWVQTQHLKTGLVYEQRKLRFKGTFTYHILDNLVVYGTDRLPYQSVAVNQIMVLRLQEHFRMRWFHLALDGAVQWRLTGDDIRLPIALGRGMFYYQNDLFKKKLRLQVGVEASYSMSYYANAYNPALSEFNLQNSKQVGNYPFLDVFLNLRVKKFRAFVQFTHINSGWLGYRYYHVPGYPVNDFAWHFGVNWAFLD